MKQLLLAFITIITICTFSSSSCKKETPNPNNLPPTTQTGANTLGFLLNGQPWKPEGFNGTANLSLYYDPNFRGGVFNIYCYKQPINSTVDQIFSIASDSIQQIGRLTFGMKNFVVGYGDAKFPTCQFDTSDSSNKVKTSGYCDITKLDKINHIMSGQFTFTLIRSGCDTIKITEGRFGLKY